MTLIVRELTQADAASTTRLAAEAFGGPMPTELPTIAEPPGSDPGSPTPTILRYGGFDGDLQVGRISGFPLRTHVPGGTIETLGIAGVAIRPENRGRGLLDHLMRRVVDDSTAPISTLYPTAPGIYRRYGFELVTSLLTVEIPTSQLSALPAPEGVTLRRAASEDLPLVNALDADAHRHQLGPLMRTANPWFGYDDLLRDDRREVGGVTIAENDQGPLGFVVWNRGEGYRPATSSIEVTRCVALTPDAIRALWRFLGGFSSVVGSIRLHTSAFDPVLVALPRDPGRIVDERPFMLAVLDVAGALGSRRAPLSWEARLAFGVDGGFAEGVDGDYLATISSGSIEVVRQSSRASRRFQARGLAAAWAGALTSSELRQAGLLAGEETDDPAWDALLGSPRLRIGDYF